MVFNATFNNISAISWQSVLLKEETDLSQVTDKQSINQSISYKENIENAKQKLQSTFCHPKI
jgi:hypothetical protein